MAHRDQIQRDFEVFHAKHPEVYRFFDQYAWVMINAGRSHGSAKLIFERIRWEMMTAASLGDVPKLNNNYSSRYARLWEQKNPRQAGFFRKRKLAPMSSNSAKFADPIYKDD